MCVQQYSNAGGRGGVHTAPKYSGQIQYEHAKSTMILVLKRVDMID